MHERNLSKQPTRLVRSRPRAAVVLALLALASPAAAEADCGASPVPGVNWSECEKSRLVLAESDLSGGLFEQTFFTMTDLRGSKLVGAKMTRAELTGASLAGADLSNTDMEKASGRRVDLKGANLSNAKLFGADLTRTDFSGAVLTGANLVNAELN